MVHDRLAMKYWFVFSVRVFVSVSASLFTSAKHSVHLLINDLVIL